MTPDLQELICLAIRGSGIPWLLREVVARRKVTIVNYHNPAPEVFDRHIGRFARLYSFISIEQLTDALEAKDFAALPPKPMLVTLDDGRVGNARLFDTIRRYRVPVVLYAVAGIVDTRRGFWFDYAARSEYNGQSLRRLKMLPDADRRALLETQCDHRDDREYGAPSALSAAQLRELIALGGTVGSHTLFHPILPRCDDAVGRRECVESRALLEKLLQRPVRHFALPNGDADARTRAWLQDAGYATCRATTPGWVTPDADRLALPNFGVSDNAGASKAIVQACGFWDFVRGLCGLRAQREQQDAAP